jgi:hypothetical protein
MVLTMWYVLPVFGIGTILTGRLCVNKIKLPYDDLLFWNVKPPVVPRENVCGLLGRFVIYRYSDIRCPRFYRLHFSLRTEVIRRNSRSLLSNGRQHDWNQSAYRGGLIGNGIE